MKRIDIYAHRGGAGLLPENSWPAYRAALAMGVDVLDIDVTITQDNVIVAYHDLIINSAYTEGEVKPIRQLSYQRVQQYRLHLDKHTAYAQQFPYQIAMPDVYITSLQTLIQSAKQLAGDKLRLQIEMKSDPEQAAICAPTEVFVQALVDVLQTEKMQTKVEVHSLDWRNLRCLQKLAPNICTTSIH